MPFDCEIIMSSAFWYYVENCAPREITLRKAKEDFEKMKLIWTIKAYAFYRNAKMIWFIQKSPTLSGFKNTQKSSYCTICIFMILLFLEP
jgi:hypothetical protein